MTPEERAARALPAHEYLRGAVATAIREVEAVKDAEIATLRRLLHQCSGYFRLVRDLKAEIQLSEDIDAALGGSYESRAAAKCAEN